MDIHFIAHSVSFVSKRFIHYLRHYHTQHRTIQYIVKVLSLALLVYIEVHYKQYDKAIKLILIRYILSAHVNT